jgi:RNA polymerase sigma-70 factor (ECF subfamily)
MTTPLDPGQLDALVVSAQGGDRQAFSRVVVEVYPQLAGFLAFHAPSPELMDEILQATFVAAFQQLAEYEPRGTFAGWLKGIARNLLRRELGRRARLQGTDRAAIDALLADVALQNAEEDVSDEAKADLLGRLRGCLDKLSPRMRLIAERRFVEDVPLNVLAQQFKQTRASIAKVIFTVRRDLRACAERTPGATP